MAQQPFIVSIPGSTSEKHLLDNIAAANVSYTAEEMDDINRRLAAITLSGHRYNADNQRNIDSGY